MRVTSGSFYDNFTQRQSEGLKNINTVNDQISTGTTIRHGYEDPITLTNTLKLDHTESALGQAASL